MGMFKRLVEGEIYRILHAATPTLGLFSPPACFWETLKHHEDGTFLFLSGKEVECKDEQH